MTPSHNRLILIILAMVIMPLRMPGQVVATMGSDTLTFDDFLQGYRSYLSQSAQPDTFQTRLDHLETWQVETIWARMADEMELYEDPHILRPGLLARRQAILEGIAFSPFFESFSIPPERVEAEYRYRNTILLARHLTLADSVTAMDYLKKLQNGESFESLVLQASPGGKLLENPERSEWRYPQELDPVYARQAYLLTPGQFSKPIRSAEGFHIIQLLGKEYRPNHGHFERVKHYQRISAELRPLEIVTAVRDSLVHWSRTAKISWRKKAIRKVVRSGILSRYYIARSANPALTGVLDEKLFTLDNQAFTLEWILARRDLLLPEEWIAVTDAASLEELTRRILTWEQAEKLIAALERGDALTAAAESLRMEAMRRATQDSIHTWILARYKVPDDSLRQLLMERRQHYIRPGLIYMTEIVVRDALLAAALKDSMDQGAADFGTLAERHTEREWAQRTGGELGWVPPRLYGFAAETLREAAAAATEEPIGPLAVDGYFILALISGYQPENLPPFEALRPRLTKDWIQENREKILSESTLELGVRAYPVRIDTALLAGFQLTAEGEVILPVAAETIAPATLLPATAPSMEGNPSPAPADSTAPLDTPIPPE
ncbi:MAG: peptidylprolyl isomerase [Fidelibacterota bacterium]|nr:MAG: peptidylprolyl isomerase [Candidatus Neomarinimicrobiota bacterium]